MGAAGFGAGGAFGAGVSVGGVGGVGGTPETSLGLEVGWVADGAGVGGGVGGGVLPCGPGTGSVVGVTGAVGGGAGCSVTATAGSAFTEDCGWSDGVTDAVVGCGTGGGGAGVGEGCD